MRMPLPDNDRVRGLGAKDTKSDFCMLSVSNRCVDLAGGVTRINRTSPNYPLPEGFYSQMGGLLRIMQATNSNHIFYASKWKQGQAG